MHALLQKMLLYLVVCRSAWWTLETLRSNGMEWWVCANAFIEDISQCIAQILQVLLRTLIEEE